MSLLMKNPTQHAVLRQAMRQCPPVISVAASHVQYLFRRKALGSSAVILPARNAHTFVDRMPRRTNQAFIYRVSPQHVFPPVGNRIHLPMHSEQSRFKSAVFDYYHDYDHSELMKTAFDADFYQKAIEANTEAHKDILKQAEEVLHGHIHDKSTCNLKILDLASGPGEPAATLAKRFPEATVFSTDINPDMVKAADERMKSLGIKNMKTAVANMEDLADFDDATFDLVTCSFGLIYCEDPDMALYEAYRVLKPGGTLITTVWDNISIERASDALLEAACGKKGLPERIIDPMAFARPRLLENHLEKNQLSLVRVSHGEYPFQLSGIDGAPEDYAFRFVSMPVYPNLIELIKSGECPNAFDESKKAFEQIVSSGDWIKHNEAGHMVTVPNRFKLVTARRGHEKSDGRKKTAMKRKKKLNLYPRSRDTHQAVTPEQVNEAFDSVLIDTYSRISNGPWQHMMKLVESIIHGHDMSRVRILDLASGPGDLVCTLAKRFPRASVVATDSSPDMIETTKKKIQTLGLRNMRVLVADPQNLSTFQTGAFDVVTCSFGLSYFPEGGAEKALSEVHRILKPGGSLVATVWDSISVEHISDEIMENVMEGEPSPPRVIDYSSFAAPRKLEGMIENSGMSVIRVDHDEFSFQLSGLDHQPDDFAFNVATIPIHPNLVQLQKSGKKPDIFDKAHAAFQKIVDVGELVHVDDQGRMWSGPNRFKMVVARRQYEDTDAVTIPEE